MRTFELCAQILSPPPLAHYQLTTGLPTKDETSETIVPCAEFIVSVSLYSFLLSNYKLVFPQIIK